MKKVFILFMLTIVTATVSADMPMKDAAASDASQSCDTSKKNDMNDDQMNLDQPE